MNAKEYAGLIREARRRWSGDHWYCVSCGSEDNLETHEMERRSHAVTSWARAVNYLRLCGSCHSGSFATMPHARQLAIKWIHDRGQYSTIDNMVKSWLRIRDPELKAPLRVSATDVGMEVELEYMRGSPALRKVFKEQP